jgi:hypothetical protein
VDNDDKVDNTPASIHRGTGTRDLPRGFSLSEGLVEEALRSGLGKFTTDEEFEQVTSILIATITQVCEFIYAIDPDPYPPGGSIPI